MHIETLKIFCDLVELESFSRTAEKHLLSQSAVSQQLAQLELVHKVQLLDRKKRPPAPTVAGQLLYDACKDIIGRYEQFKRDLNALQKPSAGRVNVAAIYSIGMHTLPDYVKKFMVKYPDVNVHIEYLSSGRIYELVLSGEADIGLVAVPRRDKRLEVYDFVDEPLVLVCSSKHPLASESQIDIHKVQFEKFIAFEKDTPTRGLIDSILQRYNIIVRPVMEFDNTETIKRAIEINAGISILPETVVLQEVAGGIVKAIPFSNERFSRPTGVIVRKDKLLGMASRYFIELLSQKS
jgi:LysR family transcriptional regulator, transcriptional activator of the cysJI operon